MENNPISYNILEHAVLRKMKEKHPDWIWNRSDTHIILGVPSTIDGLRTPVEPGNSFSPGPGSYGVSTWVFHQGKLHAPETKALGDLNWSFTDGHFPIVRSVWDAEGVCVASRLFTAGDANISDIRDYFAVELENTLSETVDFSFYLVIRSVGPAGGPIRSLSYESDNVVINDRPSLLALEDPNRFGAVNYESSGKDISCFLKAGDFPEETTARDSSKWSGSSQYKHDMASGNLKDDATSWVSGALEYKLSLAPGEKKELYFICHVQAGHWMLDWLPPLSRPAGSVKKFFEEEETKYKALWASYFSIDLKTPDTRYTDAFYSQIAHLYMFTVHNLPRISSISYPLWWLRDGSYVVTALDKAGLHNVSKEA